MALRWITLLAALLFVGCGGHQALQTPERPAPARQAQAEAKPWTARERRSSAVPAPAHEPSRGAASGAPYDADDAERYDSARPGLATSWGETRHSPTHSVSFERAQGDTPFDVAQLYYDDFHGARRMTSPVGSASASVVPLAGGAVSVAIVDAHGRALEAFSGNGRTVAIGNSGAAYALSIHNNTGERFEVVASVDGLDVIDGEDGDLGKPGYVLSPWQTLVIEGFRQSQNHVAAFRFGSVGASYAASKGKARNVGVVGVALFVERGRRFPFSRPPHYGYPHDRDEYLRDTADPFPGQYAQPPVWR